MKEGKTYVLILQPKLLKMKNSQTGSVLMNVLEWKQEVSSLPLNWSMQEHVDLKSPL